MVWSAVDKSELGGLPKFPSRVLDMSASKLVRLPQNVRRDWRGAPFHVGRMTCDVVSRPFWPGCFARFELLERLLPRAGGNRVREEP